MKIWRRRYPHLFERRVKFKRSYFGSDGPPVTPMGTPNTLLTGLGLPISPFPLAAPAPAAPAAPAAAVAAARAAAAAVARADAAAAAAAAAEAAAAIAAAEAAAAAVSASTPTVVAARDATAVAARDATAARDAATVAARDAATESAIAAAASSVVAAEAARDAAANAAAQAAAQATVAENARDAAVKARDDAVAASDAAVLSTAARRAARAAAAPVRAARAAARAARAAAARAARAAPVVVALVYPTTDVVSARTSEIFDQHPVSQIMTDADVARSTMRLLSSQKGRTAMMHAIDALMNDLSDHMDHWVANNLSSLRTKDGSTVSREMLDTYVAATAYDTIQDALDNNTFFDSLDGMLRFGVSAHEELASRPSMSFDLHEDDGVKSFKELVQVHTYALMGLMAIPFTYVYMPGQIHNVDAFIIRALSMNVAIVHEGVMNDARMPMVTFMDPALDAKFDRLLRTIPKAETAAFHWSDLYTTLPASVHVAFASLATHPLLAEFADHFSRVVGTYKRSTA
jgi:hypothetical protein